MLPSEIFAVLFIGYTCCCNRKELIMMGEDLQRCLIADILKTIIMVIIFSTILV